MIRMDKRNVVSIYLYTGEMGPWDLHLAAKDFILQNFEQVNRQCVENEENIIFEK